jgi:hypothetical protein
MVPPETGDRRMAIPNVGKCFPTAEGFLAYLEALQFGAWRPRFITMHHTGAPDLKTWQGWQTRSKPVSDVQWLKNLAVYYGGLGWSAGPHFFFTPKNFCVLSPPTARGVHAVSFNAMSWGVECVGDFDREAFDGAVRDKYVEGLACLHIATGLQLEPFEKKVRGLHFHRDDPKTTKTCPGKKVLKPALIKLVQAKIAAMTGGDHPAEQVDTVPVKKDRVGTVNAPDDLNVRAAASAKAPVVKSLKNGTSITIIGEAMNGDTKWFAVDGGFVAARYVNLK